MIAALITLDFFNKILMAIVLVFYQIDCLLLVRMLLDTNFINM